MVVYDRARHTAHCLNRPAAIVWRHANGVHTVEQIARLVNGGEPTVWLALAALERAHLLDQGIDSESTAAAMPATESDEPAPSVVSLNVATPDAMRSDPL
ncbi:MAG TPA: hypothetical protein VKX16_04825 [Chloroflexota bacterium]|nr:hypothetical protein [Chloroflexota bacterium]